MAILLGGLATRLRPLTTTLPKAMVPVAGEPFIAHQLRMLTRQGFERVVLCTGHRGSQIEAFVGSGEQFGARVEYSREKEDCLLGTGGALRHALPMLGEVFFVLYGDSYLTARLRPPAEQFLSSKHKGMMTVYRNDGLWDRSNVLFNGETIEEYTKRSQRSDMAHIDYGFGGLRGTALDGYVDGERFDLADVYRQLLQEGELLGVEVFERFYEMGSPAGLAATEQHLREGS